MSPCNPHKRRRSFTFRTRKLLFFSHLCPPYTNNPNKRYRSMTHKAFAFTKKWPRKQNADSCVKGRGGEPQFLRELPERTSRARTGGREGRGEGRGRARREDEGREFYMSRLFLFFIYKKKKKRQSYLKKRKLYKRRNVSSIYRGSREVLQRGGTGKPKDLPC